MDPQKRKETPDFYGYIPDGGSRTVIFGCMLLNNALLLLIRSFGAAMLMLAKKRYLAMYLAGDMALYLLQKVARGDFHYWMPIDGAFGLFMSLVMRVGIKTVTDFTGLVQFRCDAELGGLYWTVSLFLALLASLVSVWVGDGGRVEWTMVGAASGAWVFTFGLFFLLMKKEYRGTFFTTRTGKQWAMDFFLKAEDDSGKQNILGCNTKLWVDIRPLVKYWVQDGWRKWEADKPEWFTEVWIAKVPPDMVPSDAKQAAQDARASARRRSSLGALMVAKEEETRSSLTVSVQPVM